jgi:hypothetical protein
MIVGPVSQKEQAITANRPTSQIPLFLHHKDESISKEPTVRVGSSGGG